MMNVGETIRELRKSKNLNQDQLAELANLNRVTVAKYESGKIEPGAQALSRLADALDVTVDELLGREPVVSQESWDVDTAFGDMMKEDKFKVFARGMAKMSPEKRDNLLSGFLMMFKEDFDAKGNKK